MPLKIQVRRAGKVAVFQCEGPIISGLEAEYLEKTVNQELRGGGKHLVLEVGAVPRIDSVGLGLIVRLLISAQRAGGNLKLAAPPVFVTKLLQATRLSTLFEVFPSAQEALMAYQKLPKARIVFFDPSYDVCAFVGTVLTANGYEVLSTYFINDVRTLLKSGKTDVLLLGPNTSHSEFSGPSAVVSLATVAPTVTVIELSKDFQELDAEHAGTALLRLIGAQVG